MTTQEIETILGVPNSTLSDWSNSDKRGSLAKLLRAIDLTTAQSLINKQAQKPKVSPRTQNIKLNKKLYKKDLLWSREDGAVISIKNLITIYLSTPNQEDTRTLIKQFGEERVLHVLEKNKALMNTHDYKEVEEQIEYTVSPKAYQDKYSLPSLKTIAAEPKHRYLEILAQQFSPAKVLEMLKDYNLSYPALFKIQKKLGLTA
ncbi:MAG: hypothetical protein COA44_13980 [Arcobacter sp.]|nr:MAG: hypothetical protein COA44_13980 [Arcobacter sp.]